MEWLSKNHQISSLSQQTFSTGRLRNFDHGIASSRSETTLILHASDLNELLEKYVLVLLYFKMGNSEQWAPLYNYLDPDSHHCQWQNPSESKGIFCDDDLEVIGFQLSDRFISGTIPDELYLLTNLWNLDLGGCTNIRGTISTYIGRLSDLWDVRLDGTSMEGSIPSEIGMLTHMWRWASYDSHVNGSLPTELGNLIDLEVIDVKGSAMTGPLPVELGNLVNLESVYMFNNLLTGSLPTEIGLMTSLRVFYIEDCQFHGQIPSEIGQLVDLEQLYLQNNKQLNGTLPSQISNLRNLKDFSIGGTSIVGNLDPILCLATNTLDRIWADCSTPPGVSILSSVACSCCRHCCYTDEDSGDAECDRQTNPAYTMCYNNECTSCGNGRFVSSCDECIDRNVSSLGTPPQWIDFDEITNMEICSGSCALEGTTGMCKMRNFTDAPLGA